MSTSVREWEDSAVRCPIHGVPLWRSRSPKGAAQEVPRESLVPVPGGLPGGWGDPRRRLRGAVFALPRYAHPPTRRLLRGAARGTGWPRLRRPGRGEGRRRAPGRSSPVHWLSAAGGARHAGGPPEVGPGAPGGGASAAGVRHHGQRGQDQHEGAARGGHGGVEDAGQPQQHAGPARGPGHAPGRPGIGGARAGHEHARRDPAAHGAGAAGRGPHHPGGHRPHRELHQGPAGHRGSQGGAGGGPEPRRALGAPGLGPVVPLDRRPALGPACRGPGGGRGRGLRLGGRGIPRRSGRGLPAAHAAGDRAHPSPTAR